MCLLVEEVMVRRAVGVEDLEEFSWASESFMLTD